MLRVFLPRPFLDAVLVRVAVLWVVLRSVAVLSAVGLGASLSEAVAGTPLGAFYLLVIILVALRLEMARRSELIFLANLGYSFLNVSIIAIVQCVSLDAVLRVTVG
jgi:hypothetical protein